jgi:hypothetical protein
MKRLMAIIITICLIFGLTACSMSKGSKNYTENTGRLIPIAAQQDLYYDVNTKVVYIIFNEAFGYTGYGYMSPYFADNGKPYLYDNGGLVNIG